MHDTLAYLAHDPVFRNYHHNELTFSMMYAFSENFVLPLSHDEVVHGKGSLLGKMPGDSWRRFAGLRALLAYMWAHPGKQLLFMGSEFGQASEWSQEAGLDWGSLGGELQAGLQRLVIDLNGAYRADPAMWADDFSPDGFGWIDANDSAGNVVSFLRFSAAAGRALTPRPPRPPLARRTAARTVTPRPAAMLGPRSLAAVLVAAVPLAARSLAAHPPLAAAWSPAWPTSPAGRTSPTGSGSRTPGGGAR